MNRVRVVHPGGFADHAEVYIDGDLVTNITRAEIVLAPNAMPTVTLTMVNVELDVTGVLAVAETAAV